MLLDANLLLYAVDESATHHRQARTWLSETLTSGRRVAIPWPTIGAFLRISTHPRVYAQPLDAAVAWAIMERWLAVESVWIPSESIKTAELLGQLLRSSGATGNLIPDAMLAALAIEHGLELQSADSDFARFPNLRWTNPLA